MIRKMLRSGWYRYQLIFMVGTIIIRSENVRLLLYLVLDARRQLVRPKKGVPVSLLGYLQRCLQMATLVCDPWLAAERAGWRFSDVTTTTEQAPGPS